MPAIPASDAAFSHGDIGGATRVEPLRYTQLV